MRIRRRDAYQGTAVLSVGAAAWGRSRKCPHSRRRAQERLTLFTIGGLVQERRAAGLVIQKDGFNHCLHVPTHASAVVVELLDDTIQIIAAWITRNEALNQLAADKRPHILVVEDGIEGCFQII